MIAFLPPPFLILPYPRLGLETFADDCDGPGHVEESGASCILSTFREGFAPNVLCEYPSLLNSSEHVILSAHYDSRGSWGSTRAPGGDDDGSGTGHLLGVVEAIKRNRIKFEKSVIVAFFAGEEQGLVGSRAFAGE